ncbi:MAG: hypothetical protein IKF93_00910 [Lachnospiraceae bacterium]|nr:hypothetical protein [Lachnospiraceae bacterium]
MKKKLAKWIGSLLLISMILTSVCPLSVLAADEPAPAETTVVMEVETPQETQQEAPAGTFETPVTEAPAAEDAAANGTVTGESDQEKETNIVFNASEEGIVAGGEKATNSNEKKEDPESNSNVSIEKEDAFRENALDEIKTEEIESKEETAETVKFEQVLGESNADEKAEEEKKDNSEVPAPAISVTWPENLPDAGVKVIKAAEGTEFAMFKLTGTKMYSPDKEKLYVHVETANVSFDKIYFGSNTDGLKTGYILGTEISGTGGWVFEFELPFSAAGTAQNVVLGKPDGTWYTKAQLKMDIPAYQEPEEPEPEPEKVEDGDYEVKATSDNDMFRIIDAKLKVENGTMMADITLSGTGYDLMFAGTKEEAEAAGQSQHIKYAVNDDGKYVFTIPVSSLDEALSFAAHTVKSNRWVDRKITFDSSTLKKIEEEPEKIEDGDYEVKATSDNDMFRIIDAKLKVKNGEMTADITLSGTGYDLMFTGTKEEADTADPSQHIKYTVNDDGKYVFTIPVSSLDEALSFAAHTVKSNKWVDRKITFDSSTLKKIEEGQDPEPEPEPEPEKPVTPQEESQHETDLSGATAAVDNSTTLPDGVYTPDSFSFSGGSGRVTITCSQVTVTNGQAFATIAFSSSNYSYVKASGNTYFPTLVNGASTFTIPIALNQNNKIIGMTTAMSQAHEVEYTLFVYIAAAAGQEAGGKTIGEDNKLDEKAPVIAGIGEGEEIKLEHAKLLKMFRYDNGCVLVEIDRTKDTVLDPEKLAKEAEENKDEAAQNETVPTEETAEVAEEEGGQSNVKTDADYAMELYQADVVKYLIVPEGVEIPAGMEKQVLVIRLPKKSVYVSSEDEAKTMESLGLLDLIKATGLTEEDCKNEALKAMLKDKKAVSAGVIDDLDYTKLVKAEADLVFGAGGEILPKEAKKNKKAKDYQDQYTKITERMALLDIPMLIDRSADEKDPKGQLEWLKLYGVLFGKEKEADALIANGN